MRLLVLSTSVWLMLALATSAFSFARHPSATAAASSLTSRSLRLLMSAAASTPTTPGTDVASTTGTTTASTADTYDQLVSRLQTIAHLGQSQAVLSYDQMVFMPSSAASASARGAQLSALATVVHEKATDPAMNGILQTLESVEHQNALTDEQRKLVALARREYDQKTCIPPALEQKKAELSSSAYAAWTKARADNDFAAFAPVLKECFDVASQVAQATLTGVAGAGRSVKADDPNAKYTQMLDEFERGMGPERIDAIFDEIETQLVPLLQRVLNASHQPSTDCLHGNFAIASQEALSKSIVTTAMGFNVEKGRIDVSVHPFTTSFSPADVRITSRFSDTEWYQGLAGSMHEAGHALYEQNLPDTSLPIDTALSMGCHESQSLFWERHVGLSKAFWKYATPLLKEHLRVDVTPEEVYAAVNVVAPTLIRVEADELTYPLHVILRYRIERQVVQGTLAVEDIPSAWNAAMKELLDVDVPSDTMGCLQDVHWSAGAIGYFPTYLIGSATAAQLAHYCRRDLANFDELVETGQLEPIRTWLTNKIHQHGKRYASLDELLEDQLGESLNPQYFVDYLVGKYSELYQC
uniref:Carboxypeptidase n=1 Tax=Phaeodactylum tricornutum TaxID=2850 RepID=A0A8J9X971_PHATR